jgi:hypothetical protein
MSEQSKAKAQGSLSMIQKMIQKAVTVCFIL